MIPPFEEFLRFQYALYVQEHLLLRIFALLGPEQLEVAEQTTVLFRNFGELLGVLLGPAHCKCYKPSADMFWCSHTHAVVAAPLQSILL